MTDLGLTLRTRSIPAAPFAGLILLATALAACDQAAGPDRVAPKHTGQTIARVNGQEITEHELKAELKLLGSDVGSDPNEAARQVLRRIIQRTVLAQKAEQKNLHRTPAVMMELRRERAEVLARAYIRDAMARQLPVSKYDIDDFVEQHPHYFNNRKHYVFDQVLIPIDQATDDVIDVIKDLNSLDEVEKSLSELNVPYIRRLNSNLGNQFPRDAVMKMERLRHNQIFLARARNNAVISKIIDSRPQPIIGQEAREIAQRLVITRRDAVATRKLIDNMLATSRIEFLGEFADMPIFETEAATTGEASETKEETGTTDGGEEAKEPDAAEEHGAADKPGTSKSGPASEDESAKADKVPAGGHLTVKTSQ